MVVARVWEGGEGGGLPYINLVLGQWAIFGFLTPENVTDMLP
jgi:hypothetical protein